MLRTAMVSMTPVKTKKLKAIQRSQAIQTRTMGVSQDMKVLKKTVMMRMVMVTITPVNGTLRNILAMLMM